MQSLAESERSGTGPVERQAGKQEQRVICGWASSSQILAKDAERRDSQAEVQCISGRRVQWQ